MIGTRKKIYKKIAFSTSKKKHFSGLFYIFAHIEENVVLIKTDRYESILG